MSNDNQQRHVVTVEQWEGSGDLIGCYLVSLLISGRTEPLNARIFSSMDEALDFARDLMKIHPDAIFHDKSDGGQS